ncbi:MAG: hypothetical protein L6282_03785 [Candidatus Methanoperedenaceae archaeon]|nr:hypothetical protein [Candidatus Methanoperedenaceae archaeon]
MGKSRPVMTSDTIDFKLNRMRLHEGDRIFNATTLEPYVDSNRLEVLQYLQKENKLQDTTLLPGQSLNGTVAFRVNSLYNISFLLKYDTTTVTSASFEKSIEALRTSEHFNYFVALEDFHILIAGKWMVWALMIQYLRTIAVHGRTG